jgi:MoxR-like ATPase
MTPKEKFEQLQKSIEQKIVGQKELVNRLLLALLADGHLLVEGAPGLAKTRAIQALSEGLESDFHRVQFTPDLLPADITGTEVFYQSEGQFKFQPGPLFHHLILADEINRAPAKVQSALLEAMAERQVTVAGKTYELPNPFFVMATQNPIEQEGTYHLPEAQLDRFLMHVKVDYPSIAEEKLILHLSRKEMLDDLQNSELKPEAVLNAEDIRQAREEVLGIYMAENVEHYLLHLVMATRRPDKYAKQMGNLIAYGASPRATLALDRCARASAWLKGKDFVSPEDIQSIAHDVLRHRIILDFEAEAEGYSTDKVISELLSYVAVP